MYCYNCGHALDKSGNCPNCGADVRLYKKVLAASNRYYNDGLEKAGVRNLTGAAASLRQSIKLNKNQTDARNLLGLVYFEMGEVVSALGEWVISKNIQPDGNLADTYLNIMKHNPGRLDTMNQAIKKYNLGLKYCRQGSLDLAVIQLKKVLSLNPKYVHAHQLLALLYLNEQKWTRARAQMNKCLKVDTGSTLSHRYANEADRMMMPEQRRALSGKKKNGDAVQIKHGNETIIQPVHHFKPTSGFNISGLLVGMAIGIAFSVFLILPAQVERINNKRNQALSNVSEEADKKTSQNAEYEQQIKDAKAKNDQLQAEIDKFKGTNGTAQAGNALMRAVNAYLTDPGDIETIATDMEDVSQELVNQSSADFKTLYNQLLEQVGPKLAARYYQTGYAAYKKEDYKTAISDLTKCYQYDQENGDALFFLGMSYYRSEDTENAIRIFDQVIHDYKNTDLATRAENYIAEINNARE